MSTLCDRTVVEDILIYKDLESLNRCKMYKMIVFRNPEKVKAIFSYHLLKIIAYTYRDTERHICRMICIAF